MYINTRFVKVWIKMVFLCCIVSVLFERINWIYEVHIAQNVGHTQDRQVLAVHVCLSSTIIWDYFFPV